VAAPDIADEPKVSLAEVPPSARQRRVTSATAGVVAAAFGVAAAFAVTPLARVDGFLPFVQAVIAVTDLVTAALLCGQFTVARSRPLLVLADGYLFSGLTVVAHTLTFPGAFGPSGLLGADAQTAAWLYLLWHLGFAGALLVYAVFKDRREARDPAARSQALVVWLNVAAVAALVAVLTWSASAAGRILPPLVLTETSFAPLASRLSAINLGVSVLALAVLWTRRRSVLDRWLIVALVAAVAEASLIAFVAATRYTVGFYAGRLFALVVSSSVLAAMLWETTQLYMRLSAAVRALRRERANKLMNLEVVVASVAHEIKQPLTVISTRSGVLQRLLKRPQPDLEAAQRNLAEMERASFGIAEVFESIRALFRNPAQGKQPIDPNELALSALGALGADLNERGIKISTELTPGLPAVLGHKGQLHEVLLNIVQNAIDAMGEVSDRSRHLRVTTAARDGARVTISIEDTGVGIAPERLANLFDAFVTTKSRGTGLGLGICRMIVDRHEGQLSATSELNRGTRFDITLPVVAVGVPASAAA
jgi:signal transduction histidine kinase